MKYKLVVAGEDRSMSVAVCSVLVAVHALINHPVVDGERVKAFDMLRAAKAGDHFLSPNGEILIIVGS